MSRDHTRDEGRDAAGAVRAALRIVGCMNGNTEEQSVALTDAWEALLKAIDSLNRFDGLRLMAQDEERKTS